MSSLPARVPIPSLLPGTRPNVFTTIQGNALSSTNGVLPDTMVRLRDARAGRIVDTQTTDKSGLFAFKSVDPGSYIVELVGNDQSILAASQILNVNAGEAVSAVVKLPFRLPPFGGLLGHTIAVGHRGFFGRRGLGCDGHGRHRTADQPGPVTSDGRAHV